MEISLRLKEIVNESSLTQTAIAEKVGINRQYLYQLLSGRNNPSTEVLIKLSDLFGVNLHWLIKGEGVKYVGQVDSPKVESKTENENLKNELLSLYRFIAEKGLQIPPHIAGVQNSRQAV